MTEFDKPIIEQAPLGEEGEPTDKSKIAYHKPSIRERLIRKLNKVSSPTFERVLIREMGSRCYKQTIKELSGLLSQGFVVRLGTGHRGDAYRIALSKTWPFDKCPMCGCTQTPHTSETPETTQP